MEQWVQFGILVGLFLWMLNKVDGVKSELTRMRNNDFMHFTDRLDSIQECLTALGVFYKNMRKK